MNKPCKKNDISFNITGAFDDAAHHLAFSSANLVAMAVAATRSFDEESALQQQPRREHKRWDL
jgi:hypothetical protein